MCADARTVQQAGPHAKVEEVQSGPAAFHVQVTIDVPFDLKSLADAQLDISTTSLLLRGPDGVGNQEVKVFLPSGFILDPDGASAKYSRKRRQLIISSPNVVRQQELPAADTNLGAASAPTCSADEGLESLDDPTPALLLHEEKVPSSLRGSAEDNKDVGDGRDHDYDDDDDDDLPPPLESARNIPCTEGNNEDRQQQSQSDEQNLEGEPETNAAAEALINQALSAREKKRAETEKSRRSADLASGGLKKGFLSNSKAKKKSSRESKSEEEEEVPYIGGNVDPEAARRESLKLPEVQHALRQNMTKMQEDKSWLTPQLMQALQSRPDLLKGLSDPRVQEAMQLMQSNPEEAKRKYGADKEVTKFLQEFSSLMATHFDVLGKEPGSHAAKKTPTAQCQPGTLESVKQVPVDSRHETSSSTPASLPLDKPEIVQLLQDPEVQELLGTLRAGRQLEMHELIRSRPRLFKKIKVLLDNGLLSMQT